MDNTETRLLDILSFYWSEYPSLREENQSLDNREFQDRLGFAIKWPWSWLEPICSFIKVVTRTKQSILVVYSNTNAYTNIYQSIISDKGANSDSVKYISWQEIYWAVNSSSKDVRPMQSVKRTVGEADLVVICNASQVDEDVLENIKIATNGCLVCIN